MRRRQLAFTAGIAAAAAVLLTIRGVAVAQTGPMGYLRGVPPEGAMGRGMMGSGGAGMMGSQGMMPGMGGMMGRGGMMGGQGMMGMTSRPADRWFIEEMIPHHEDAIVMADLALKQAEHAELRTLAQQIAATQSKEIADMRAWYRSWFGVAEVPAGAMDQMHKTMHADPKSIDGARPFDKAFIEHMVPHHQMAVMMATHALAGAEKPELQTLLQSIITSQSAEIRQMQSWYRSWYGGA